jgi:hypothetical protein
VKLSESLGGNSVENSTDVFVALLGGLVGAFITGSYQFVYDWIVRPELKLDFEGKRDCNIVDAERTDAGKKLSELYIRARLRNTGKRPAKNCLVFLTRIEEVQPSGTTLAPFHDASPVSWAGWNFSPRTVPRGVDFYCDVMKVSKDDSGWHMTVEKLFSDRKKLSDYRGTYRFHLLATADNAEPESYEIDVTYDGDWHNLRAIGRRST